MTMFVITVSDFRRFIIPDIIVLPAAPAGLIVTGLLAPENMITNSVLAHVAAMFFGGLAFLAIRLSYRLIRGRDGLGLGDVKLAAVAGAWVGPFGFSQTLLLACLFALVYIICLNLFTRRNFSRKTAIPFGAFLAPAIWIIWTLDRFSQTHNFLWL